MPTSYENRIGALSPVLWTKLDGSGAPTSSGSATPTFTLSGTAPTTGVTSGILNTCYTFNGNGQYSIGTLPSNTTTDKNFTMEAWIKMNPSTSMDYPTIYRADNGANGVLIMRVRGNNVASPGLVEMYMKGNSTAISFYSTSRVDDNNWHHIVFRHDGFSYFLYVDGVQEHFGSTGTGAMNDIDSAGTRYLGGGTAANEYFVGTIDEFAIYGSTLNPGQIYGNYATGKYPTSMQAKIASYNPEWYWEGDAVDAATPTMNNYGTSTDVASWTRTTVSGSNITRVSTTLPTSTANPYMLSIPYASRYRSTSTQIWSTEVTDKDFVFGIWWKMNTGTSGSTALTFIGGNAGSGCGMYMYSQTHVSTPGRIFWNAAGSATSGTTRVDDGNWHFIAIRKSSANNDYKCYIDGVLDATITTATTPSISNWQIGDSTQGSQSATGYIDSMFIASPSNVLEADLLGIYQLAFPANVNVNINETPATASSQFPDATAIGTSTVSISDTPATANAEFVTPALSFTNDLVFNTTPGTATAGFGSDAAALTDQNLTADPMNASADDVAPGLVIDDGYTALPGTANVVFALVEPTIITEKSAIISQPTPMTASAEAGGRRYIREIDPLVTQDRMYKGLTGGWDPADFANLRFENTSGSSLSDTNYFVFDTIPARVEANRNNLLQAKLVAYIADLFGQGGQTQTIYLHRILSPWSESDAFQPTISSSVGTVNVTLPATNNMEVTIDLTPLIADWANGTYPNYGFALTSGENTAGWRIHSSEAVNSSYRPKVILVVDYGLDDVGIEPTPLTASALAVDPNIIEGSAGGYTAEVQLANANIVTPTTSLGTGPTITGGPFVAFGENITQPTVSVQKSYNFTQSDGLSAEALMAHPQTIAEGGTTTIDTAPYLVTANMPGGTAIISESLVGDVLTASAEIVDPTISSDFNRIVYVGAFSVAATLLDPTEAILETDDPYYQEIIATSNLSDTEWFRLDEISGSIVYSKTKQINASNLQANGTYVNAPVFGNVGPRNRKVIGFTGSQYITVPHAYGANGTGTDWLGAAATSVSEMTIKTLATSGTLLDGEDANTLAGAGNPLGWTLDIYNGKLRFRSWVVATNVPGTNRLVTHNIIGNKLINDNEWHHIVVQIGNQYNGKELEIFIDGELDIARFDANQTPIMAHPDRLFGNSVTIMNYAYTGPNPTNQIGNPEPMPNFAGEAMEYVFRPNITLTEYQIEQLYYAALDIATEPQTSWTASAVFPEPYISGNKPKALVLSFWAYSDYRDTITFNPTFDEYANGGARFINGGFNPEVHDVWEYYINRVSANPQLSSINDTPETNGVHRDPVTDEVVLLDPRTINNIDKFDVISIQGYPKDSNDISNLFQGYNEEKGYQYALNALEVFVSQVREIVDTYGTSLLVTSPRLAADLGIIDDVEEISQGYETRISTNQSSQNLGLYDYRSAQIDPTANPNGPVVTPVVDPYTYFDTHRNNKIRLVATQTGLTDIQGGWTLEDAVTSIPRDPLSPSRYSYKFKDTRTGMVIGDQTFIAGLQLNKNELGTASGDFYGIFPANSTITAIPLTAVKSGTVLAQLTPTYWDGTQERVNPYANYAAAIVVNPGDSVKGTAIGGKIYVDITNKQDTRYANFAVFQTTNGDSTNPIIPGISATESAWTNYERQWQYSTSRLSLSGSQVGVGVDQVSTTPGTGGTPIPVQNTNGQVYYLTPSNNQLFSLTISEKYPTINAWAPSLLERGIMWLSIKTPVNPNDKTIRPAAMLAEALHKDSGLYINKDIVTNAASMVSNVYLVEPDNVTSVDARIVVLPLTATARITGYSRIVSADPMTASAILNTDSVTFAGGEQVVVTLHEVQTVDLYMKEEAY
jgi:Concanavalin A-like lectin/glucanases superfamily